jgi:hypothetical protein
MGTTIPVLKEQAQAETPLLLFDVTFPDDTVSYWCTHAVTYNGHAYQARVVRHNFFEIQAMSEQGIDQIPRLTLILGNADSEMSELDMTKGFKGATVTVRFLFYSLAANAPASDSLIPFSGYFNPPDQVTDLELQVTAVNSMNMQRVSMPPFRIQRRCPWSFPATADQRAAAAGDPNSPYYQCGYSPDITNGSGAFQSGSAPYTACSYTRQDCILRGMFSQDASTTLAAGVSSGATSISVNNDIGSVGQTIDIGGGLDPSIAGASQDECSITGKNGSGPYVYTLSSALTKSHSAGAVVGRPTRRFGGLEFLPPTINVRPFGSPSLVPSAVQPNVAQYNDSIPMVYGTGWIEPVVTVLRNDGNLTRMDCLLSLGQIQDVQMVVVNGYQIPAGVAGRNMTASGWYNLVNSGSIYGEFDLNFTDANGNPQGDPYGSMAYLSVVVPNSISNGSSIPETQVLLDGRLIETFDSSGNSLGWSFTNNPAWVLLDVLKQGRWTIAEINLPSFAAAAAYCAATIPATDNNGNPVSVPRFQCNLILQDRRPASEVILGIRTNARLFFTYGADGKLWLNVENTIAAQQPSLPYGSNATAPINGGWPAYCYDSSSIVRQSNGASSLKVTYRSITDTPNRLSFEFQDAFNGYQQDSFAIDDVQDQDLVGQEITQTLIVDGIPTYDQAERVAAFALNKSIDGNQFVSFLTTVKALGQQVGQIIAITYAKEGWVSKLFRILKLAPQQNYRLVQVTAQAHDDEWYSDTAGQFAPPYGVPGQPGSVSRAPFPLVGTKPRADGDFDWNIWETTTTASDGSGAVQLSVPFAVPATTFSTLVGPPVVNLTAAIATSGGALPGGETLFYSLTATDASGLESPPSFAVTATIPVGTNTNAVTLTGIGLDTGAASFSVYRGATPLKMFRIAGGISSASTFQDTGLSAQDVPQPDPFFDHANFYWKYQQLAPVTATIFGPTQIGAASLSLTANQYQGFLARIWSGTGAGQVGTISTNSATTLSIAPNWTIVPDSTSVFLIEDPAWRAGCSAQSSPAQFIVPNQHGQVVLVQGLAADAQDDESPSGLAVVTAWTVGGAGPSVGDTGVPPVPTAGITVPRDGTIVFAAPEFSTLANTAGISSCTYRVNYVDELGVVSTTLAAEIGAADTTIQVASSAGFSAGNVIALDAESIVIQSISGTTWTVQRGQCASTAATHASGATLFLQVSKVFVYPFGLNFFGSSAAPLWSATESLPCARIAALQLNVTNTFGDSAVAATNFLGISSDGSEPGWLPGLRTNQGGQFTFQVDGVLFVESAVAAPLPVHAAVSVRDVYAVVGAAPTGAPVTILLRRNAAPYTTVMIAADQTVSGAVSGASLAPLQPGDLLTFDLTGIGSATPGQDLTLIVRL